MYDELVTRLKEDKSWVEQGTTQTEHEIAEHIQQAADAIEELTDRNVWKWIPVTERLPDQNSGSLYICLIVGGEYDQLSWYELCDFAEGQFWIKDELYEGHVTHWMPLPKPPEEE